MQIRGGRGAAFYDFFRPRIEKRQKPDGFQKQQNKDESKNEKRSFVFRTFDEKRNQHQNGKNYFDPVERVKNDSPDAQTKRQGYIRRGKFERRLHKRNRAKRAKPNKRQDRL